MPPIIILIENNPALQ